MMLGNTSKALAGFAALTSSPVYANASKVLSGLHILHPGEYAEARHLFDTVDKYSSPGDQAPYFLTQIAFHEANYDQALAMARRAISENPHSPYAPEMLRIAGESSYQTGDTPEAIGYLQRYLDTTSIDKAEPSALYILGINAYQQGELDRAVKLLTPRHRAARCHRTVGLSLYRTGISTTRQHGRSHHGFGKSLSSRLRPISARNSILQLCRYTHGRRTHTIRQFGGIDGRLPAHVPQLTLRPTSTGVSRHRLHY